MKASDANSPLEELRGKLAEARLQALKLEDEIARLEQRGQLELPSAPAVQNTPQSPAEKVALFLDLFGTRRSVFPKRWENAKTGKSGYAPACDNEWRLGICRKPQIKCTECPHQKFPPLDDHAVEAHLRGIHTLGVYAIDARQRERGLLLSCDYLPRAGGAGAAASAPLFRAAEPRGGAEPPRFSARISDRNRRIFGPVLIGRPRRSGAGGASWHENVAAQNLRQREVDGVLCLCPGTWRKWCENLASLDVTNRAANDAAPTNQPRAASRLVANGIGAGVDVESADRAAVAEAEASAAKQAERVDVAMRGRARSGNSQSLAATMEALLTFAEAARVLGISLRQ